MAPGSRPRPVRIGSIIHTSASDPAEISEAQHFLWSYVDLRYEDGQHSRWVLAGRDADSASVGALVTEGSEYAVEQIEDMQYDVRMSYEVIEAEWVDLPVEVFMEWNHPEPGSWP